MHQQQERRVRPQLAAEQLQQQQLPQKCPRCDSLNTKFCYYNNYSLSQPRYFCKTCRRYWTQGGTLRNVPVGGGCRKGKRSKKPSSSSSSSTLSYPSAPTAASADSGFHHSLLLPPQQPQQDSILVATSAASSSPLRNVTDAITATASGCSSTSPSSSLPYFSAGGGGFFSSLIAMQSYNHAMNAADFAGLSSPPPPAQATTGTPFNYPLVTGFNMPLHHQQHRIPPQPAAGFQMGGGAVDRPLQQLLIPTQPSRSSAGAPPVSLQHQEWPPHTIAPDGGYWQSNVGSSGAGGPPSSGGHWPDLPGFGPSSSSPSFL